MKLDFTQSLNKPENEFDFTFEWKYEDTVFNSIPHKPLAPGIVNVKYKSNYEGIIDLNLEIRIPFNFVCDKCADEFEKNLYIVASEKVEPWSEESESFTYDSNGEVDIEYIVNQVVLSSFPQQNLCSPNCKGLCNFCGVNLNYDSCNCKKNKIGKNNPFADLLGLYK